MIDCACGCGGVPKEGRFLKGHYVRTLSPADRSALARLGRDSQYKPTTEERLWPRVEKTDSCWLWLGPMINGYGTIRHNGRDALVHRVVYELRVGPIPDGLTLDHLCRVRRCCNPSHLEPVTNRENTMRGAAPTIAIHRAKVCARGHPYEGNRSRKAIGRGYCLVCERDKQRKRYAADPEYRARIIAENTLRKRARRWSWAT